MFMLVLSFLSDDVSVRQHQQAPAGPPASHQENRFIHQTPPLSADAALCSRNGPHANFRPCCR
jgi:hypothetical protein